ncbi:MAG: hypothetical protein IPN40_00015 [Uliginosibacterium sp.]|nr:hypothetical protein [Uliginosibacterium sp.]
MKFVLAAFHLLLPTIRSCCMGRDGVAGEARCAGLARFAQGFPPADARGLLRIAGGRPDAMRCSWADVRPACQAGRDP